MPLALATTMFDLSPDRCISAEPPSCSRAEDDNSFTMDCTAMSPRSMENATVELDGSVITWNARGECVSIAPRDQDEFARLLERAKSIRLQPIEAIPMVMLPTSSPRLLHDWNALVASTKKERTTRLALVPRVQ